MKKLARLVGNEKIQVEGEARIDNVWIWVSGRTVGGGYSDPTRLSLAWLFNGREVGKTVILTPISIPAQISEHSIIVHGMRKGSWWKMAYMVWERDQNGEPVFVEKSQTIFIDKPNDVLVRVGPLELFPDFLRHKDLLGSVDFDVPSHLKEIIEKEMRAVAADPFAQWPTVVQFLGFDPLSVGTDGFNVFN